MKIFIKTFGCRANQYDSEALRAIALDNEAELVESAAQADVAVFNSCAVTSEAEADLRQAVRRAARENPKVRTLVMGCASALELQRETNTRNATPNPTRMRALPQVEELFDGADVDGVARAIGLRMLDQPAARQTGARALLRIQDGCDEHCTFCATTIARGITRSRPLDELVTEATQLAEYHSEIVLTGVHIGGYGADIKTTLGHLVERLVTEIPGARFRLSSLEATEVDDRLGELLTSVPRRLAPYLHAPLQSGSDRILKRMGRHWYSAASYRASVERLVSRTATFGLGADVICGFPGETEDDFAATVELIRALPFTSLHVFSYSPRPGTAATKLPNQVKADVVAARSAVVRALASEKAASYARSREGQFADIVVTGGAAGPSQASMRSGLSEDYLTVQVAADAPRGSRFTGFLRMEKGTVHADRVIK